MHTNWPEFLFASMSLIIIKIILDNSQNNQILIFNNNKYLKRAHKRLIYHYNHNTNLNAEGPRTVIKTTEIRSTHRIRYLQRFHGLRQRSKRLALNLHLYVRKLNRHPWPIVLARTLLSHASTVLIRVFRRHDLQSQKNTRHCRVMH